MSAFHNDLIYDVGLQNGGDTAYYLHQGYRVVAVEADPSVADAGRARFANEIAAGRLTLLNVGIAETAGSSTFWICDRKPEWSSFHRRIASRHGAAHHAIEIPTRPFADILAEHGVPVYLKIDIEGNDPLCIRDLAAPLPKFVSVETECLGEEILLTESGSRATLDLLADRGYTKFKLIFQRDFSSVQPDSPAVALAHDYPFKEGDSGPWGDETPGPWLSYDDAIAALARAVASKVESWHDWHAS